LVVTNLYPPEFLGGYELGCAQMVEGLRQAGHDVEVITSVSAHAGRAEERHVQRVLEVPPIYSRARMNSVPPSVRQYFHQLSCTVSSVNVRALGEAVAEFQPDVAYLWNLLGLGGLGVLGLLAHQGVPWVWHVMDSIPRQMCGFGTTGDHVARELNPVFPGRYIMCSSHVLGEIREGGVELGDHVRVMPNWVCGDPPPPRTRFFDGGTLRLMSASGTVSESKGARILIEAAANARDRGVCNFTLDIYGYEEDAEFRRLLHVHDVVGQVNLCGPRRHDELLAMYSLYDVFAFPTWSREPFGFAPLEAAAAGCVPLVTDDCGYSEWVIDGVDCLKAERSAAGFADRLIAIATRKVDLSKIGRRAQAVAWRDFHISKAVDTVEAMLREATASNRPPRSTVDDFFHLSTFAEGLISALVHEAELA
jgi:glycosyltransferase involved in cell wall biosynthesis